jgi:hypothetical protein
MEFISNFVPSGEATSLGIVATRFLGEPAVDRLTCDAEASDDFDDDDFDDEFDDDFEEEWDEELPGDADQFEPDEIETDDAAEVEPDFEDED